MKQIFIYITIVLSFTSCKKFLDVNEDPNKPVSGTLPLKAKFPAALVSTMNQETGQLNQIGALWGGYWGTNNDGLASFIDLKTYNGPALRHQRDGIPVWEDSYTNLMYYQLIREEADLSGMHFYAGAAKIMQGWHFLRLVDIYNNVPFEDALKGTREPTPVYEDGKTVYEKSIALISQGIQDIKNTVPGTEAGSEDIMFQGDKTKWIKFANTIKLRALLRQSETDNINFVNDEIRKIMQEGSGFLGVGENAFINPGYLLTAGKMNPLWESFYRSVQGVSTSNRENIRPTIFSIEQYEQRNDPRLATMFVDVNGQYKGVLFGNPSTSPEYDRANTSAFKGPLENGGQPAGIFKSATQPSVLLASFESLFLQAEAAERGWIAGSAAAFYNSAIEESFKFHGVLNAYADYINQPTVDYNTVPGKIANIITQKWLALNGLNSIEAWNDYRRLGVPAVPNSLDVPAGQRPLRLMYPETERMTNNAEASKQGSDDVTSSPVWWDKN